MSSRSKKSITSGHYNFKEHFQPPNSSPTEEKSINVILNQLKTGESTKFCEWLSSKKDHLDTLGLRVVKDDSGIWMKGQLGDCLSQLTLKRLDMQVGLNNNLGSQGTTDLVEVIGKQKSLEELKILFEMGNNISQIGGIKLGQMLKNMTQLSNLCVTIGARNSLRIEGLRGISEGLRMLVNLQELEVKIGYTNSILAEGAIALSEGLKYLVNLRKFSLQIGDYNDISINGATAIGTSISKMVNLEDLTISIDSENTIGSYGATGLFNGLGYQPKLKNLKLSIDFNNYIENWSLSLLGKKLQQLQELQKFQLFIGANNTSMVGEAEQAQKLLLDKIIPENNMKNLKEIDIFIGPQNMSLWQDERTLANLSKQRALERFTIRLGAVNEVKPLGAKYLMNAVSSVENLRYLNLTIGGQNDLGPEGATEIGNGLKKLTQLKELVLTLAGNGITGQGLRGLSECFREDLKSLESLILCVGFQNKYISGMIDLFENISHQTQLRNLEFSLQDNEITINHAENVAKIITRMKYLSTIKFHFEGNPLDFSTPFIRQMRKHSPRLVILGKCRRN